MAVKVAINGFGRIGRNVLRAIIESGRAAARVPGGTPGNREVLPTTRCTAS